MSLGIRETSGQAVRSGLRRILFSKVPEADACAIDEYLKSLRPTPSPKLIQGRLSDAARRGKTLFESPRVGCVACHPPPLFTDLKSHSVGSENKNDRPGEPFDTPALIECWRTAPYFHDGRAAAVLELFHIYNRLNLHGHTSDLSSGQLKDLAEYVLSL